MSANARWDRLTATLRKMRGDLELLGFKVDAINDGLTEFGESFADAFYGSDNEELDSDDEAFIDDESEADEDEDYETDEGTSSDSEPSEEPAQEPRPKRSRRVAPVPQ
jgi:hypothetical protein